MPKPAAFEDFDLSCDWNQYSNPRASRALIGKEFKKGTKQFKDLREFFICALPVNTVRQLNQEVKHDPKQFLPSVNGNPNNRAHSLIIGDKIMDDKSKVKIRAILSKNSSWEIFDLNEYLALKSKAKLKS